MSFDELGLQTELLRAIAAQGYSLSIPLYIRRTVTNEGNNTPRSLSQLWAEWERSSQAFWQEMNTLIQMIEGITHK